MAAIIKIFRNIDELSHYFAEHLASLLKKIPPGHNFSMALSGGSTPEKVFEYLSGNYKDKIEWEKLLIFWGDERCVPPGDHESNFRMAKESLLDKVAVPVNNIFRIKGEEDPRVEAVRYAETVSQRVPMHNGIPRFDLVLLGMGEDGHTASIFPGDLHLFSSEKLFEVAVHPQTKQKRITITGKVINNAAHVIFIATGGSKSEIIERIIDKRPGWENLPASKVQPANGELTWLLDEDAAAKLQLH